MNEIVEEIGEPDPIALTEIVEAGADALHPFRGHIGRAGDGRPPPDGIGLARDVDLEVDGGARWIVAETSQQHPRRGDVLGLQNAGSVNSCRSEQAY